MSALWTIQHQNEDMFSQSAVWFEISLSPPCPLDGFEISSNPRRRKTRGARRTCSYAERRRLITNREIKIKGCPILRKGRDRRILKAL